ncbi:DUF746 domain-containing protein [Burkholderia sola]|nr:DUF746 domain-containing protein [Burkholderia sola]
MFECHTCRRYFSRTVGTPFGEKHLKKLDLFVSLLSRPISCVDAGERMGSLSTDIGKRVMAWRTWLSQIDPIGEWKRRVRLDGRPTEPNSEPLVFSRDRSERRGTQLVRLPLY